MNQEIAGIVLAGGLSKRYKGDKLLASIEGKSMLSRVLDSLTKISKEPYLSVSSSSRAKILLQSVGERPKVIVDNRNLFPCEGPVCGILSSLSEISSKGALFVPADIPWVSSEELSEFVTRCEKSECDVGTVFWSNGAVEILIQYHKVMAVFEFCRKIASLRKKLMRPSDVLRGSQSTAYVYAGNITRNPFSLSNVNTREELSNPKPRNIISEEEVADQVVPKDARNTFFKAIELQAERSFSEAAKLFKQEAEIYEGRRLDHVAFHCLQDAEQCLETVGEDRSDIVARILKLRENLRLTPRS
jgi:molybdopterin-guanine dinucleotide biosynthesis protein A